MLSCYRNSQVFLTDIRIDLGTLSAVGPPDARIHPASGGTTQSQAHFEKFTLASPEVLGKQTLNAEWVPGRLLGICQERLGGRSRTERCRQTST